MFCRDRRTTSTRLTIVSASTTSADEAERDVHGALVVERTRRKVGPQHHATCPAEDGATGRSRSRTPTGAASASSRLGARADAIAHRRGGSHVDEFDPSADALLDAATQPLRLFGAGHRRAGEHDAREAAAAEPILVIHRRLVDEVGEVALGAQRPIAEEDEIAAAHDRERHVVGADMDQQPVAARRAGRGQLRVDQAEAGDIDEARVHARGRRTRARSSESRRGAPSRRRTRGRRRRVAIPGHPGDLRVLDPEGRRLADLPVNQLVEILRLSPALSRI